MTDTDIIIGYCKEYWPVIAAVLWAGWSELLALNPQWRSNGIVQLLSAILGRLAGKTNANQ